MSHVQRIALVDTNVWLDNYLGNRSGSASAKAFLSLAYEKDVRLVYPVHILKDVFFNIKTSLKRAIRATREPTEADIAAVNEMAWGSVNNMRAISTAVGADDSDLWLACKFRPLLGDLEDNLVLAAAERAQVDFIVTNDKQLIRKSTRNAFTSVDAVNYLSIM